MKFHDGSDFTCTDAKYSLDKLADPNGAYQTFVAIIEKVFDGTICTDDFTLVLHLRSPRQRSSPCWPGRISALHLAIGS